MSERPVRTTRCATRGLSVQDVEDEGSLEDDEAEEYIDDMKLDEARAEERDEDWQEPSKRRKKKKKAKEPVMKDRGQLKQFQALPLDLVGEICSYLSPLDLLNWGRASKPFRQLFFSSSSASLWRLARKSVNFPDLTWPMPEPEYASLMYEKHCMDPTCDKEKPSLPRYDFYHRLRLCGTCARATFALLDNVAQDTGQVQLSIVKRCYVSFTWNPFEEIKISNRTCLKRDLSSVNRLITNVSKNNFLSLLQGKGRAASEVAKRILEFQAEIKAKEEDGDKLHKWRRERLAEMKQQEDQERLRKCNERKAAIEAKFIADNWDPIDFDDDDWINNEIVDSPKKLTPADWRNCQEELTNLLEGIRDPRLETEADDHRYERIDQVLLHFADLKAAQPDQVSQVLFPSEDAFMNWPVIDRLIEEDEEITDETWTTCAPQIDAQIRTFLHSQVELAIKDITQTIQACSELEESITRQVPGFDSNTYLGNRNLTEQIDFLSKFAYLFPYECNHCHASLFFPHHLAHSCTAPSLSYSIFKVRLMLILDLISNLLKSVFADKIPLHTEHLDRLGESFECRRCSDSGGKRYNWRLVIDHVIAYHPAWRGDASIIEYITRRGEGEAAEGGSQ